VRVVYLGVIRRGQSPWDGCTGLHGVGVLRCIR
jgi:hypothetical protein